MRGALVAVVALLIVVGATTARAEGEHGAAEASGEHGSHGGGKVYWPQEHFRFFGSPFGHGDKDAVGGKLGDNTMTDAATNQPYVDEHGHPTEEPMSAPFIFMVLNFAVLFWILASKGGPVVSKLAAERHDQIKSALDEAGKLRKEAQDRLAEYETKLKAADAEITKLVEGMRTDAEADKKRMLENAERQAAQLQRDAEQRIAAEIAEARAALTREVTAAAAAAAEKLLRDKMTSTDQQKVVAAFIADVESSASRTGARS